MAKPWLRKLPATSLANRGPGPNLILLLVLLAPWLAFGQVEYSTAALKGTQGESLYARPWNAGRNTGIGPSFYGLDMRLTKAFYINRERGVKLDVLVEGTNILNHTNFSAVNDQFPADPTFALPNGGTLLNGPYRVSGYRGSDPSLPLAFKSAFDPRQVQFGLKLIF